MAHPPTGNTALSLEYYHGSPLRRQVEARKLGIDRLGELLERLRSGSGLQAGAAFATRGGPGREGHFIG
jgi:hypothetical protein